MNRIPIAGSGRYGRFQPLMHFSDKADLAQRMDNPPAQWQGANLQRCNRPTHFTQIPKLHRLHRSTQFHQAPLECGGHIACRNETAWTSRVRNDSIAGTWQSPIPAVFAHGPENSSRYSKSHKAVGPAVSDTLVNPVATTSLKWIVGPTVDSRLPAAVARPPAIRSNVKLRRLDNPTQLTASSNCSR